MTSPDIESALRATLSRPMTSHQRVALDARFRDRLPQSISSSPSRTRARPRRGIRRCADSVCRYSPDRVAQWSLPGQRVPDGDRRSGGRGAAPAGRDLAALSSCRQERELLPRWGPDMGRVRIVLFVGLGMARFDRLRRCCERTSRPQSDRGGDFVGVLPGGVRYRQLPLLN